VAHSLLSLPLSLSESFRLDECLRLRSFLCLAFSFLLFFSEGSFLSAPPDCMLNFDITCCAAQTALLWGRQARCWVWVCETRRRGGEAGEKAGSDAPCTPCPRPNRIPAAR